ncbi:hypothetical protein HG531_013988 [Fusarium graminearum]|nr:hypothetical protein HG531_013988 [Fusarium graminearum]
MWKSYKGVFLRSEEEPPEAHLTLCCDTLKAASDVGRAVVDDRTRGPALAAKLRLFMMYAIDGIKSSQRSETLPSYVLIIGLHELHDPSLEAHLLQLVSLLGNLLNQAPNVIASNGEHLLVIIPGLLHNFGQLSWNCSVLKLEDLAGILSPKDSVSVRGRPSKVTRLNLGNIFVESSLGLGVLLEHFLELGQILHLEAYLPDDKESVVEKLESNTSTKGASKASGCGARVAAPETSRRASTVSNIGSSLEDLDKRGNCFALLVPKLLPCGMSKEETGVFLHSNIL